MTDITDLVIEDDSRLTEADRKIILTAKREWENRLFNSDLSLATKAFGFIASRFAYGAKTVCWPTFEQIMANGDWNNCTKFGGYIKALVDAGALRAVKAHHTGKTNKYPNYKYTMNLDWEGSTSTKPAKAQAEQATTPDEAPIGVPIADAQPEQAAEPPEVTSTPQRRAIDPRPWTTEELAAETPEPDPVETLRQKVRKEVGRTDEVDDLLSCIPEEYRSEYAERLYGHVLDTRHLTGNTLTPVLCEWLESDGRPIGKLALAGW